MRLPGEVGGNEESPNRSWRKLARSHTELDEALREWAKPQASWQGALNQWATAQSNLTLVRGGLEEE
jgi:hypothetical protein